MVEDGNIPRVSLFVTCVVDQFYPKVGESTVRLLRRLGVDVNFPQDQTCCGQPAFNSGFREEAKPVARRFMEIFNDSEYIVAPSGSCVAMVREYYSELFRDDEKMNSAVRSIASRVYELSEFIVDILGKTGMIETACRSIQPVADAGHPLPERKVTYHDACHLRRELGITTQPRKLIGALHNIKMVEMEQSEVCCGFGGTFSIKYPEISAAMLRQKLDNIRAIGADTVVACDSTCVMQMEGGFNKEGDRTQVVHLAQLLDEFTDPTQTSGVLSDGNL